MVSQADPPQTGQRSSPGQALASSDETIVAIASSHDAAGHRGIVRISGPHTVESVQQFFRPEVPLDWQTLRTATRIPGSVRLSEKLGEVPCDLLLWPTSRSYTQQPTAELHTYGSLPILNSLLQLACEHGARLAQPGEFTLRSFLSGRIDLAQAEAVLGVIDAVNDREIQVALSQLAGGLSQPLADLRNTLLNLVADLEAGLDFVDEDIEFISRQRVLEELTSATETIGRTLRQIGSRDSGGPLPRVVLRGEPNAGKSSIWNALVNDGSAIVDASAGTTRDYLVGTVETEQGRFALVDTAGVESAKNDLQETMLHLGQSQAETANLILLCIDSSRQCTPWEVEQLNNRDDRTLVVQTKSDIGTQDPKVSFRPDALVHHHDAPSIAQLAKLCSQRLSTMSIESSVVANTASRCRETLRLAGESTALARELVETASGDELVVSELRTALDHLGQVVGAIYNDDILDRVFSRFCIGK